MNDGYIRHVWGVWSVGEGKFIANDTGIFQIVSTSHPVLAAHFATLRRARHIAKVMASKYHAEYVPVKINITWEAPPKSGKRFTSKRQTYKPNRR